MSVLSNGYLLALTEKKGVAFDAEFLVIAGGGQHQFDVGTSLKGGGGAGGYISSVSGESSGGGTSAISAVSLLAADTNQDTYTVTVGAAGSNSVFSGDDSTGTAFSNTAVAGGGGGAYGGGGVGTNGDSGGSGGGGDPNGNGGAGTTGQGFAGANGNAPYASCDRADHNTVGVCSGTYCGGGGGAGAAGSATNGGVGVQSSITGTATYYAGGGRGAKINNEGSGTAGNGQANYGGGGNEGAAGQNGVVMLKYPTTVTISNAGGGLTMSTSVVSGNNVTVITAGTGSIEFTPA